MKYKITLGRLPNKINISVLKGIMNGCTGFWSVLVISLYWPNKDINAIAKKEGHY